MLEVSCLTLNPVTRSVSPKHFSDSELKVLETGLTLSFANFANSDIFIEVAILFTNLRKKIAKKKSFQK